MKRTTYPEQKNPYKLVCYIYGLRDPITDTIRYVGKTYNIASLQYFGIRVNFP